MRVSYAPELLAVVDCAVDQVWSEVATAFDTPRSRQAARRALVDAILAKAAGQSLNTINLNRESLNAGQLTDAGWRALALKYPWLIEPHASLHSG